MSSRENKAALCLLLWILGIIASHSCHISLNSGGGAIQLRTAKSNQMAQMAFAQTLY
jgi:hypothetical protein